MSTKKSVRKTMKFVVSVAEGLVALNPKEETLIDINVFDDMKLVDVHQSIVKVLQLKGEEKFFYCNDKLELDRDKTFGELGLLGGDKLTLECGRKRRRVNLVSGRLGKKERDPADNGGDFTTSLPISDSEQAGSYYSGSSSSSSAGVLSSSADSGEVLELICSTRIFDNDSDLMSPIRRVRVLVCSEQLCKHLMEDISELWGRSGLKFKCGRTVLNSDKSFEEQGVENNAEIVVTGGRG